jgi:proteasome maturation protein
MELQIVAAGEWTPAVAMGMGSGPGIAGDILSGRDSEIGWEDIFSGNELREIPDFHTEMEARMRMNW